MIDSIFEECLSALPFWPCFHELLSEVIKFLRVKDNRRELAKRTAGSVRSTVMARIKSIAGRRWGNVASVLRRLDASIEHLAVQSRVDDRKKDGWGGAGMARASSSGEWQRQLKLCSEFSAVAESLRSWGTSSCRCHGVAGSPYYLATCTEKGRNLPFIGEKVKLVEADIARYVHDDLNEACGGSDALISAMKQCYANFVWKLRHKAAFMDELPWLVVFGNPPNITGALLPRCPPPRCPADGLG